MSSASDPDPLALLADEFLSRWRAGERPAPEEYAARHPALAPQIRDLFPTLLVMENFGGSFGQPVRAEGAPFPLALGEYRLLRQIGRGGMGVVYEAVQEPLGRHVALKVLSPHLAAQGSFLERFRREAKIAARLHHTHIVPVFGVGDCDGTHYYAMQFIPGQSLDKVIEDVRRLRAGSPTPPYDPNHTTVHQEPGVATPTAVGITAPLSSITSSVLSGGKVRYFAEVARLGTEAAEALAHAHAQGVLHRDIKPANLLLDAEGSLWITDFGLAKIEGDDLTGPGEVVGTLRYLAPERFDGRADERSDLYALGLTLYELLALRHAFPEADRARLIRQITHEQPPRLRQLDPSVPRDLETVVLKAMAPDPRDRYGRADELAEDLRRFAGDRPILARRQRWPERLGRWARHNPGIATMTGILGAVLLAAVVGSGLFNLHLEGVLKVSEERRDRAERAERERTERLLEARIAAARALRFKGGLGQRYGTLEAVRQAAELARDVSISPDQRDELRTLTMAALALPDLRALGPTPAPNDPIWGRAYDARLSRSVAYDSRTRVEVRRIDESSLTTFEGNGATTNWLSFSNEGRYVAMWDWSVWHRVVWWDLDSNSSHPLVGLENVREFAFDPSRPQAGVCYSDGSTAIYDTATGQLLKRWDRCPVGKLTFNPRRPQLAISRDKDIDIRDLEKGDITARLPQPSPAMALAWHPHGRVLAAAGQDRIIRLWDVVTGTQVALWEGCANTPQIVSFHPRGHLLVTGEHGPKVRVWDVRRGKILFQADGAVWKPGFDVEGRLIAGSIDGRMGPVEVPAMDELRSLARDLRYGPGTYTSAAVSEDGRWLVAGLEDGANIWDLDSGESLLFLSIGRVGWVGFETDGTLLTNTPDGLFRWPFPPGGSLGAPNAVTHLSDRGLSRDRMGRILANAQGDGVEVRSTDGSVRWLPHTDGQHVSVSPDGRYVASGCGPGGAGVKVWEAATGQHLHNLWLKEATAQVRFSPDGRFLVTFSGGECRFWQVETWEEVQRSLPSRGLPVFNGDGSLLAVALPDRRGVVGLFDAGGRLLARLEDPLQRGSFPLTLSPDGSRLVVLDDDRGSLRVWDLRRIRRQLDEWGLDWEAPPFPPARQPTVIPNLSVVGLDRLATLRRPFLPGRDRALEQLVFNPFDADAHHRLGHHLFNARRPAEAHAHLNAALAFNPNLESALPARARAAFALKRWAETANDATRVLARHATDSTMRSHRAQAYEALGRYVEAVADYTLLIEQGFEAPVMRAYYQLRARCYRALGERIKAQTDRDEVIRHGPIHPILLNEWARDLVTGEPEQRQPTRARELINDALRWQPEPAGLRTTLGLIQYRSGQFADARATLEPLNDALALFVLAMCHHRLGDAAKAKVCIHRAIQRLDDPAERSQTDVQAIRQEAEALLTPAP